MMSLAAKLAIQTPSPEQVISPHWANLQDIQISIKRDDLLHSIISGNKWRKLKHALLPAVEANTKHIISFGGGFSNHIHALGYCCQQLNIQFTAIIRGDYSQNLSPMLQDLLSWRTDIQYVDRATYQRRTNPNYLHELQQQYPHALLIPEGGSQLQALKGVAEIVDELCNSYDYVVVPVASGGTLAGLITGLNTGLDTGLKKHPQTTACKILGVGVLKGEGYLEQLVMDLLPEYKQIKNWHINHDYHFGGYAKSNHELTQFCQDFYHQTEIKIEPVYSGKLFFALRDLITKGYFPQGSRILALHTGGLQGAR
ncbi:MAG: 1-aminocyclopropane-1-carboxylate deaminase [Alphaproteobacteria bacterium]|jgi:1-aminocyclopropane-1-carboxylate deaminase